jgi:hypothetical protein
MTESELSNSAEILEAYKTAHRLRFLHTNPHSKLPSCLPQEDDESTVEPSTTLTNETPLCPPSTIVTSPESISYPDLISTEVASSKY